MTNGAAAMLNIGFSSERRMRTLAHGAALISAATRLPDSRKRFSTPSSMRDGMAGARCVMQLRTTLTSRDAIEHACRASSDDVLAAIGSACPEHADAATESTGHAGEVHFVHEDNCRHPGSKPSCAMPDSGSVYAVIDVTCPL